MKGRLQAGADRGGCAARLLPCRHSERSAEGAGDGDYRRVGAGAARHLGRGFFVLYADFSGNLDSCIAICSMLAKNGKGYVQAGAGIVADSVPELEYQESLNKAQAVIRAIKQTRRFTKPPCICAVDRCIDDRDESTRNHEIDRITRRRRCDGRSGQCARRDPISCGVPVALEKGAVVVVAGTLQFGELPRKNRRSRINQRLHRRSFAGSASWSRFRGRQRREAFALGRGKSLPCT